MGIDLTTKIEPSSARAASHTQADQTRPHLSNVVKVTMRDSLHLGEFAVLVQQDVEVPLALEVAQSSERERFGRAVRDDGEDLVEILEVLLDGRDGVKRLALVRAVRNICKGCPTSRQYTLSRDAGSPGDSPSLYTW